MNDQSILGFCVMYVCVYFYTKGWKIFRTKTAQIHSTVFNIQPSRTVVASWSVFETKLDTFSREFVMGFDRFKELISV